MSIRVGLIGAALSAYLKVIHATDPLEVTMNTSIRTVEPFVRAPAAGSTLNVLGVTHIYKATAAETGGAFSLWEAVVPPGHGAPPHKHGREHESFYVLSGELMVEVEGHPAPYRVGAGGFFFGACGHRHTFRNVGDQPARALIMSTPSVGLDRMFAELDSATVRGVRDIGKLAEIAARFGVAIEKPAALE
jgi:mannose-6-phosphate isomerase-like protein (cupin superfamily)